jgi:hypothetical protein
MNTPPPLEPLDDDVMALIAADRALPPPPPDVEERVWRGVELSATLAASGVAAGASGRVWTLKTGTLLTTVALSMGVGAWLHATLGGAPQPSEVVYVDRPLLVPAPAVTAAEPTPAPPPRRDRPTTQRSQARPIPPVVASAAAGVAPQAPAVNSVDAELALLDLARAALLHGDGPSARAAMERHAREFPDGMLVEEAGALHIQALAMTGEAALARERGAQFLRRYPRSMQAPTVRRALETLPP